MEEEIDSLENLAKTIESIDDEIDATELEEFAIEVNSNLATIKDALNEIQLELWAIKND